MSSEFSGTESSLEAISFIAKSYKVLKSGFLFQYNNFSLIQPQLSLEDCSPLSPVETRLQHLISAMYLELCMVLWEEQLLQGRCCSAAVISLSCVMPVSFTISFL